MPTTSRLFLKLGLVYFIAATACGVAMAWAGGAWGAVLLPTYLHLFVVGWITQIIIGVALWLFPKWTKERPRGREWLAWTTLITINLGLLLRAVAEPGQFALDSGSAWQPAMGWMLIASAALQWAGGIAFVVNIWGRIKPRKARRKKKGRKKKGGKEKGDQSQEAS